MWVQLDTQSNKQKSLGCSSGLYLKCSKEIKWNLIIFLKIFFLSGFLTPRLLPYLPISKSLFSKLMQNFSGSFKPQLVPFLGVPVASPLQEELWGLQPAVPLASISLYPSSSLAYPWKCSHFLLAFYFFFFFEGKFS